MSKEQIYHVKGMTCQSCESLIADEVSQINGVECVKVSSSKGTCAITGSINISEKKIQRAISKHGYELMGESEVKTHRSKLLKDAGWVMMIVAGTLFLLDQLQVIPSLAVADSMSLGFVFVLGLAAAFSSCAATSGGVLLAVSSKYDKENASAAQRWKPALLFNGGRLIGYTVFGGAIGLAGSALTLSPFFSSGVMIVVSVVMILLGLQMLGLQTVFHRYQPRAPKKIAEIINRLSAYEKGTPSVLGGLTFFLPCGFTQALQFYVLGLGDWKMGAITMGVFALGTLPGLMSIGALHAAASGELKREFLKYAGAFVIIFGLLQINGGLRMYGVDMLAWTSSDAKATAPTATVRGDVQIVEMAVDGLDYRPNRFTVQAGVPVEWRIDASKARGCAQILVSPKLRIQTRLSKDTINTFRFTPEEAGFIDFNCSMGMMTPGSGFAVVGQ